MRRAANLFDQIADSENLRLAFYKAARGANRIRPWWCGNPLRTELRSK
jgi:hypothetical protein